jgi:hypothetical protein
MNESIERMNSQYEFLEGLLAADQALIAGLKEQRAALRQTVEMLLNCADPKWHMDEIRKAHRVLSETKH